MFGISKGAHHLNGRAKGSRGSPYAPGVDEEQRARERDARRQAREERRRAQGRPLFPVEPAEAATAESVLPERHSRAWDGAPSAIESFELQSGLPEPELGEAPPADEHRRRLAVSTAIFGIATGLSRVLGLVREMVAAYFFGAAGPINAFTVAFQLPNLIRALVADAALSSAFVPVFSDLLEKGERKRAWRVASSLLWLMLLGLGGITALFILLAPLLMNPLYPQDHDLVVGLSRLLFPIVALLGASGIIVGILNSYDEFSIPALAPVAWNVAIILGLVLGVPHADTEHGKLYGDAGSILVGTLIQVLLPVPWLRGRGGRLELVIDWRDPAVRRC